MQGQIWPELVLPLGLLSPTEELLCPQRQGYLPHAWQGVWRTVSKSIESELMAAMGFNIMFVCKWEILAESACEGGVCDCQAANLLEPNSHNWPWPFPGWSRRSRECNISASGPVVFGPVKAQVLIAQLTQLATISHISLWSWPLSCGRTPLTRDTLRDVPSLHSPPRQVQIYEGPETEKRLSGAWQ